MWTALSGAPWWQRSGVPSTPFTHDERGHQQAPARGVDCEDSTQPKAGTVLVRMRKLARRVLAPHTVLCPHVGL